MDPELQNWQSSLSAQQLSKHTATPATGFSKAFGDTKYLDGSGKFTRVYRGTFDKPLEEDPDGREYQKPESTMYMGQHWTANSAVARTFAINSNFEGDSKKGRVFSGLAHTSDIWDPYEKGAEDHFNQYAIWHPNDSYDEDDEDGFNESEQTIKPDSPVVLNKITTYNATGNFQGRQPLYTKADQKMKPGTVGKVGNF